MDKEIFDVVDENDQVIDHLSRDEVHRRGLNHRAIHLLVFNGAGEVFLQKRSMSKDTHPGAWDSSVSGHVDRGETYDDCAVREALEEIGLRLESVPRRLFKIDACRETDREFVWVYCCEAEGPFQLHPDEIETGAWFAPDALSAWVNSRPGEFAPAFVYLWKKHMQEGQAAPPGVPGARASSET